jgi:hypothetical protein
LSRCRILNLPGLWLVAEPRKLIEAELHVLIVKMDPAHPTAGRVWQLLSLDETMASMLPVYKPKWW